VSYKLVITEQAMDTLQELDRQLAERILRKMHWVAANTEQIRHKRLRNLPPHLEGLCKYRIGSHRALYWIDHNERRITLYDVLWRKGGYKELYR
jgi:mRNA-degrading endonuclease RelE of RelBE toxin-antitoxin system